MYHNQLSVQNGLYYDGPGAGSPYIERLLTLAAPLARSVPQQARFYLDPALLLGNRGRTVSSLLVSFGNGAAAVLCQPGQAVSVSYPSAGPKVLQFTVQFADGSSAQAQARARLLVESQPGVTSRGMGTASRAAGTGLVIRLPDFEARDAFPDYNGSRSLYGKGEALAVLHNATSKSEGAGFMLRNPVVIMDGFDPNDETTLDDNRYSPSLLTQLEQSGILAGLENLQRDLIILNFPKSKRRIASGGIPGAGGTREDIDGGTDYVERNAYVLETLLNRLKTRLAPDPATGQPYQYTVIGPSMGGLIALRPGPHGAAAAAPHRCRATLRPLVDPQHRRVHLARRAAPGGQYSAGRPAPAQFL